MVTHKAATVMIANFQALDVFTLGEVNQMGGAAEPGKRAMPASIT